MNPLRNRAPIRPELIAAKVAQIRNFEQEAILEEIIAEPRLLEVLWFIAWMSRPENCPGGVRRFAEELIADSRDLIGTATMQANRGGRYSDEAREKIVEELPDGEADTLGIREVHMVLPEEHWDDEPWREVEKRQQREARERKARLKSVTEAELIAVCVEAAKSNLAAHLIALCEEPHVRFRRHQGKAAHTGARAPWYFVNLADALLRFIDQRSVSVAAQIAETTISREVMRWLRAAMKTRIAVTIEGNSRFGKTEAVRTFAAMHPGRVRLVETPRGSSESDLLQAVAFALGIEDARGLRGYQVRTQIDYVLRQSQLMLIFDESQFLYPSNCTRNTEPARLNWVRRSILDAGLPAAFICTPQSLRECRNSFLKATGFTVEQWDGRVKKTVHLPDEIPSADLLAIARVHFPEQHEKILQLIVERLGATERNYCSDISSIAALARLNATDAGRKAPIWPDIKAAIADILPPAPSPLSGEKAPAERGPCKGASKRLQRPCNPAVEHSAAGRRSAPDPPFIAPSGRSPSADATALSIG